MVQWTCTQQIGHPQKLAHSLVHWAIVSYNWFIATRSWRNLCVLGTGSGDIATGNSQFSRS